jgi:hypothetical protein
LPPFVIRAVHGGHFPARRGYVNSPQPWKMPLPNPPETEGVVDEASCTYHERTSTRWYYHGRSDRQGFRRHALLSSRLPARSIAGNVTQASECIGCRRRLAAAALTEAYEGRGTDTWRPCCRKVTLERGKSIPMGTRQLLCARRVPDHAMKKTLNTKESRRPTRHL